jgi:hypothetical protein
MILSDFLENHIFLLENQLLEPEVRSSPDKLRSLLSDDFFEFGSSGKVYDYKPGDTFIDAPGTSYSIQNFKTKRLSGGCVLATYNVTRRKPDGSEDHSLRSSIWKRSRGAWKMVFHQGTKVNQ